jgi:hypothetical protein
LNGPVLTPGWLRHYEITVDIIVLPMISYTVSCMISGSYVWYYRWYHMGLLTVRANARSAVPHGVAPGLRRVENPRRPGGPAACSPNPLFARMGLNGWVSHPGGCAATTSESADRLPSLAWAGERWPPPWEGPMAAHWARLDRDARSRAPAGSLGLVGVRRACRDKRRAVCTAGPAGRRGRNLELGNLRNVRS